MDIKKLGRFRRVGHRIHGDHGRRSRGSGLEFLHIAIDDRTRLAYAALFPDETAASATAFLALAHRWFAARGVAVRGLLTDNGSAYRGHRFGALCGRLGLRHHWTRPYRPQTNGKAERFIRTCLGEWAYARSYPTSVARASALPDFLRYYNEDRFHMGINGLTPMQRLATHSEQRLHQLQLGHACKSRIDLSGVKARRGGTLVVTRTQASRHNPQLAGDLVRTRGGRAAERKVLGI